jgi:hypothetical protein
MLVPFLHFLIFPSLDISLVHCIQLPTSRSSLLLCYPIPAWNWWVVLVHGSEDFYMVHRNIQSALSEYLSLRIHVYIHNSSDVIHKLLWHPSVHQCGVQMNLTTPIVSHTVNMLVGEELIWSKFLKIYQLYRCNTSVVDQFLGSLSFSFCVGYWPFHKCLVPYLFVIWSCQENTRLWLV